MPGKNIGVDLGTTNVIFYEEGRGIVLSEPSVVALNSSGVVIAAGKKAYDMLYRNPGSVRVVCPLSDGVIKDYTATHLMIDAFFKRLLGGAVFRPNVIVCVPSSVTDLEKRTVVDMITAAGAARACLMEEPLAAAIGAGCPVSDPKGNMIVDIGGGTTDIAVITMGSIAVSKSKRIAGNTFDEAIRRMLRMERNVVIGKKTARRIKETIACAGLREAEIGMTVSGKNYINGLPVTTEMTSVDCYLAIREHIENIISGIRDVLEITPPELVGDIDASGIILTGGGSLLKDLPEEIEKATGIHTRRAADPINCVANGMGLALTDIKALSRQGYIFRTREEITGFVDYD